MGVVAIKQHSYFRTLVLNEKLIQRLQSGSPMFSTYLDICGDTYVVSSADNRRHVQIKLDFMKQVVKTSFEVPTVNNVKKQCLFYLI